MVTSRILYCETIHHISLLTVLPHLKMQMISCTVPRIAHIADHLALLHLLSCRYCNSARMGVPTGAAISVPLWYVTSLVNGSFR